VFRHPSDDRPGKDGWAAALLASLVRCLVLQQQCGQLTGRPGSFSRAWSSKTGQRTAALASSTSCGRVPPGGVCTPCLRANDILMDIQMNQGFKELGKDDRSKAFRQQAAELKKDIDTGATVHMLMKKFPDLCVRQDPFTMRKHVEKANEKRLSSLPCTALQQQKACDHMGHCPM